MFKKSVKHLFNFIFSLMLSLCFALSFSVSSYALDTVSHNISCPYVITSFPSYWEGSIVDFTLTDNVYSSLLGSACHVSFNVPLNVYYVSGNSYNFAFTYAVSYTVSIDYYNSVSGAQRLEVLNGTTPWASLRNSNGSTVLETLSFDGNVNGFPQGIYVTMSLLLYNGSNNISHSGSVVCSANINNCFFTDVYSVGSDNGGSGGSQQVEVEYTPEQISTNGLMSTNGFSPLILATNGNVRYFGNLGTYDSKFGYPAFNMSDFESGSSAPLTLFEGQYPDNGISNVHPVAFMGDCRKGEYEIVFGFITSNNPVNDQNVDFTSGWSGELVYSQTAFPLFTSDMKYNYRVQYNPVDGYFYNTVWLRFETIREFDSLCIRSGPTVSNLVHGAFCVNKFVGTVADQLNLDNYQWNYKPTNIDTFNQNNTTTGGAIDSADSAEQGFFDNYDSAVSSSGIENFDLSVIGNSLLFVQMLVNRFYSILPDKLQYLIFASLVFGVLGAILGVTRYVIKHESRVSRSKASDKKGD